MASLRSSATTPQSRLVIRPSGTEPVIRVMAEGDDEKLIKTVVSDIVQTLTGVAA